LNRLSASWWQARLRLAALVQGGSDAVHKTLSYEAMRRFVYAPRPDDVFVVSYPKSGTTLMQMILFQLTTDGDLDRLPHLDAFSPWFEYDLDLDSGPFQESLPSPRVFKSHLQRRWLPRQGRFIYLVRDVRDVALSAYHHFSLAVGREVELDPFVDSFLAGHPMFSGSWFRHVRSWWPHRGDPNVLFVTYDEMVADLAGTVRRVAAFCGLAPPEAAMPRILERCGIAYMREHDEWFDPRLHARVASDRGVLGRGEPGAGRRELSPRQRRRLADKVAALARELEGAEPSRLLRPEAPAASPEVG
jgi:hypothetical protein